MIGKVRNYRNEVLIHFNVRGDNFSLKVPHHGKWIAIIKFLNKRGFTIGENPSYKEHYSVLSKYHKLGYKKDVACLMEIGANSINVEFGNIQNLWKGHAQSFWSDPSDDRYTQLTYLQNLAVRLELKKLTEFCMRWKLEFKIEDDKLSPEEFIINKLKINNHIHGKVECLDDIKKDMERPDSYNSQQNSWDKNKKRIICGELKYFYDYQNKRLSCGIVWHNINNMWWVIASGRLRNIASFELFDFDKSLSKRKSLTESKVESLLDKFTKTKEFNRCSAIWSEWKHQIKTAH